PDRNAGLAHDERAARKTQEQLHPYRHRLSSAALGHRRCRARSRVGRSRSDRSPRQVVAARRSSRPRSPASRRRSAHRHRPQRRRPQLTRVLRLLRILRLLLRRHGHLQLEAEVPQIHGRRPRMSFRNKPVRSLRLFTALAVLFACLSAAAQFSGPALPPTTGPAILFPASRDVVLGGGDVITVRVFGPGDYAATVPIGVDGKVQLPLIGVVSLQGITVNAAESLIAQKLVDAGMFRDPQVTITLVQGPRATVSIIGEVHGIVPIVGERRLLDVLAAGGGLPATASHVITINRPGLDQPIVVDLGTDPAHSSLANIPIFGGDTIVIARVGVVYVLGAFKSQGAIPLVQDSPLTLLQVAALSGGPSFEGDYGD